MVTALIHWHSHMNCSQIADHHTVLSDCSLTGCWVASWCKSDLARHLWGLVRGYNLCWIGLQVQNRGQKSTLLWAENGFDTIIDSGKNPNLCASFFIFRKTKLVGSITWLQISSGNFINIVILRLFYEFILWDFYMCIQCLSSCVE